MAKKTDGSVIIMILVVVAVAVLGAFAVAPTIKDMMSNRELAALNERVSNGTATIADLANTSGMKVDEFIAQYELKADEVNGDTNMTDFMEKLTLKNYCTFMGMEFTDELLTEYKAANEEAKDLTAETTDLEAKNAFVQYIYELQQAATATAAPEAEATDAAEAPAEAE